MITLLLGTWTSRDNSSMHMDHQVGWLAIPFNSFRAGNQNNATPCAPDYYTKSCEEIVHRLRALLGKH